VFDIGFWEILVLLVVLLLVVGPERLPAVARTTAVWIRKVRRLIAQVKYEVSQELQAEELRQSLKENKHLSDNGESASPPSPTHQEKTSDPKGTNDNP
jgi:sec-independent protein translocase protein TatB